MMVVHEIFSITHPLTAALQAKNIDLAGALKMTEQLISELENMRESYDKFNELFTDSTNLAREIEEEIKIPRTVKRQIYRDNFEVDSPGNYFRLSIFNPFVDHFVVHLKDRFMKHKDVLGKIQNILPYIIVDIDEESINESIEIFLLQWPIISDVYDQIVK